MQSLPEQRKESACIIARRLAKSQVNLALVDLPGEMENLNRKLAEIHKSGVRAIAIPADITNVNERRVIVDTTDKKLGSIDILINNAGINAVAHFMQQGADVITETINNNLTAPMLLSKLVLPHMLERRQGHIVSVSSGAGKFGIPFQAAYAASKAGLIQWSAAFSDELKGSGIGLSVIIPTFIDHGEEKTHMNYTQAMQTLIWNFLLDYDPVGIRFVFDESEKAALPVTHVAKAKLSYCMYLAAARSARHSLYMDMEKLLCKNA